jgi:hypothetical protein
MPKKTLMMLTKKPEKPEKKLELNNKKLMTLIDKLHKQSKKQKV